MARTLKEVDAYSALGYPFISRLCRQGGAEIQKLSSAAGIQPVTRTDWYACKWRMDKANPNARESGFLCFILE